MEFFMTSLIKTRCGKRRLSTLVLVCVASFALFNTVWAEEPESPAWRSGTDAKECQGASQEARDVLFRETESRRRHHEREEEMFDLVVRKTLDKERIAAEAKASMRTLKEMGNPHVPAGFLLKQAQDDPDRQVDSRRLAAFHARMVKTRRSQRPEDAYRALHGDRQKTKVEEHFGSEVSQVGPNDSFNTQAWVCSLLVGLIAVAGFLKFR